MAAAWEAQETASYIAEVCLNLKRLALDANLGELAQAIEEARQVALAASHQKPAS